MTAIPDTSTEGLLRDLIAQVRALRTNLLEAASVQKVTGEYVTMAALAFGIAAAVGPDVSRNTNSLSWIAGDPQVDVLVTGGALRVDVAAQIVVGGLNLQMAMGYRLLGPGPSAGGDLSDYGVRPADVSRAVYMVSKGNAAAYEMSAGRPDLVTGLAPGWYRVQSMYRLAGETNTAGDTFGSALAPTIFAQPF